MRIFVAGGTELRARIGAVYALLAAANIGAWIWALVAFQARPVLLGTAMLAYGFGLRHAVDADHIAAIDNVTRKLMQDGRRPVAVGLYFSLGHASIVFLACIALAATATRFHDRFATLQAAGSLIGTGVSVLFLLGVAVMNIAILAALIRTLRRTGTGPGDGEDDLRHLLAGRGLLARLLRPLFAMIRSSWHMYPLGLLFGLGFDTATEIGLLGLSATQASHGLPIWSILVFPALFTAAMALVDTTDGILMLGAYGWAFIRPRRKLTYNITITLLSVVVALGVGGIELLGLLADRAGLSGGVWRWLASVGEHFGLIGCGIVASFALCWAASVAMHRRPRPAYQDAPASNT